MIRGTIEIEFSNNETARVVYESVLFEHKTVPYRRSRMNFSLKENKVIMEFIAKDNSALRGTLNSYLRWIKVALDVVEL
ncbi:KEOPS complex subunit Pcc1 [Thermococcus alcaliphilus]|uniref:KEOPS complex subunit Pcc1 n=1 Tax=Thermococcus alcaliphilus TaxID=139207 RepID=UPI002091578D|nr:KEOPS complex subunit Pcc1 [Thermococcus alcaliphilus]MCO6041558.1 KEOPS complex subunit Pcc1 [Thermococcus alcaliphilus]